MDINGNRFLFFYSVWRVFWQKLRFYFVPNSKSNKYWPLRPNTFTLYISSLKRIKWLDNYKSTILSFYFIFSATPIPPNHTHTQKKMFKIYSALAIEDICYSNIILVETIILHNNTYILLMIWIFVLLLKKNF